LTNSTNSAPQSDGKVNIEGVTFTAMTTHLDAKNEDIISIYSKAGMGARGMGGVIPIPGCKLTWSTSTKSVIVIQGDCYVGIRKNSPKFYDFALVPSKGASVPVDVQNRIARQKNLNGDSVFVIEHATQVGNGSDFFIKEASEAVWLCKLTVGQKGSSTSGGTFTLVDW